MSVSAILSGEMIAETALSNGKILNRLAKRVSECEGMFGKPVSCDGDKREPVWALSVMFIAQRCPCRVLNPNTSFDAVTIPEHG